MRRTAPTIHLENAHAISGPGSWTIVDASLRDLRQVAAIQTASFRPGLAYRMAPLITLWALPFVTFLVAKVEQTGEIVGCVIGDRNRENVCIMNIAVHLSWRRRGIATALLQAISERLPEGNIELMVEEPNRAAQALYELEGFVRTGYKRDYYGRHHNGIEMTLERVEPSPTRNGNPISGRITV